MGIFGPIGDWINDKTTDVFHAVTGTPTAAEKRANANMIGAQLNAYKEQTEIAKQATDTARQQQLVEKRRINEKQIASMRRHFQPSGSGFLNSESDNLPNTLGA